MKFIDSDTWPGFTGLLAACAGTVVLGWRALHVAWDHARVGAEFDDGGRWTNSQDHFGVFLFWALIACVPALVLGVFMDDGGKVWLGVTIGIVFLMAGFMEALTYAYTPLGITL